MLTFNSPASLKTFNHVGTRSEKELLTGVLIPDYSVGAPEVPRKSSHIYMVQVRGHPLKTLWMLLQKRGVTT